MTKRLPLLLAAFAAIATVACRDTKSLPVVSGPTVADSADQVFFHANFVLTSKGIQRGELKADTAYVLDDQTRMDLRKVHVTFTTESGALQGTMEATKGTYSTRTQVLDGRGNVIITLVDGHTLRSPHVTYNQLTKQVTSDTNYTITKGSDTQSGVGFATTQSFKPFNCLAKCVGSTSILLPER